MVGGRFNGSVDMAGLGCGRFGLSNNVTQNKSYIHVKLTDSAFRAIEEYLRIKVSALVLFKSSVLRSKFSGGWCWPSKTAGQWRERSEWL